MGQLRVIKKNKLSYFVITAFFISGIIGLSILPQSEAEVGDVDGVSCSVV